MKSNNQTSGGISFLGLLTIVFIVLKLTNVITWSWWWVLAPLWLPLCIAALVGVTMIGIGLYQSKKRR